MSSLFFMFLHVAKSLYFNPMVFETGSPKLSTILWISAFPI